MTLKCEKETLPLIQSQLGFLSLDQMDLFRNYSYLIGLGAEKKQNNYTKHK